MQFVLLLLCVVCNCLQKHGNMDEGGDRESIDGVVFENEFVTRVAPQELDVVGAI